MACSHPVSGCSNPIPIVWHHWQACVCACKNSLIIQEEQIPNVLAIPSVLRCAYVCCLCNEKQCDFYVLFILSIAAPHRFLLQWIDTKRQLPASTVVYVSSPPVSLTQFDACDITMYLFCNIHYLVNSSCVRPSKLSFAFFSGQFQFSQDSFFHTKAIQSQRSSRACIIQRSAIRVRSLLAFRTLHSVLVCSLLSNVVWASRIKMVGRSVNRVGMAKTFDLPAPSNNWM